MVYVGPWTTLIVTGTRNATEEQHGAHIERGLMKGVHALSEVHYPLRLVHGAAKGADSICAEVAVHRRWEPVPVPAKWKECGAGCPSTPHRRTGKDAWRHGEDDWCPYAGPRRNQEMVDTYKDAAIVVAFPSYNVRDLKPMREQSRGTWDMIERCLAASLTVVIEPLYVIPVGQLF